MISCQEFSAQLSLYLDDELKGAERAAFEDHLQDCTPCRSAIIREGEFLSIIRESKPLYETPGSFRDRIVSTIGDKANGSESSRSSSVRPPGKTNIYKWMGAVAAVIIVSIIAAEFVIHHGDLVPENEPSEFAMLAVDTHLRHLRGQLPFEIVTNSPQEISNWFVGKVSFSLKLPNYQESSGQEKIYELEGARLVGFKNDYAAYVAYEMKKHPITLVVTSNSVALPSGGEQLVSKGMTFHYDSIDGLKVMTWSDLGLTYALVSDLDERGQQSCLVCHQGTKDHDFIENLKPSH
jgi:anti-sigma factor RsiW